MGRWLADWKVKAIKEAFLDWGCSSVGRALDLHSRGLGFNSPQLHFLTTTTHHTLYICTSIKVYASSLFLVLLLMRLWPNLTLSVFCLGAQHGYLFLDNLFLGLVYGLMRLQFETVYLGHELFSLEIGF